MKKRLCVILMCLLGVCVLTACGEKSSEEGTGTLNPVKIIRDQEEKMGEFNEKQSEENEQLQGIDK